MAGYVFYSLDADRFRHFLTQPTPEQLAHLGQSLADGRDEYDGEEEDEADPLLACSAKPKALAKFAAKRLPLANWYGDLSETGKTIWEGAIFDLCMDDDSDLGFRVDHDGVYWDVVERAWKHLGVPANGVTSVAFSAFGRKPFRYHPPKVAGSTFAELDRAEGEHRSSLQAMSKLLEEMAEDVRAGRRHPDELLDALENAPGVLPDHRDALKDLLSDDEDDEEDGDEGPDGDDWNSMHSMHDPEEVRQMVAELHSVAAQVRASPDADIREQFDELLAVLEKIASEGRILFVQVDT
jgi:hypothetical protein